VEAEGWLYLVDCKKDLIISGGFNVYPQLIEQAIYTHPDLKEFLVIGIPDKYRGEAAEAILCLMPLSYRLRIPRLERPTAAR
jgi:long-chain acyl-CoA synthetase